MLMAMMRCSRHSRRVNNLPGCRYQAAADQRQDHIDDVAAENVVRDRCHQTGCGNGNCRDKLRRAGEVAQHLAGAMIAELQPFRDALGRHIQQVFRHRDNEHRQNDELDDLPQHARTSGFRPAATAAASTLILILRVDDIQTSLQVQEVDCGNRAQQRDPSIEEAGIDLGLRADEFRRILRRPSHVIHPGEVVSQICLTRLLQAGVDRPDANARHPLTGLRDRYLTLHGDDPQLIDEFLALSLGEILSVELLEHLARTRS